jgi:hypothetical protein
VTDARTERVYADKIAAREFLHQARDFLNDARIDGLGPPSRIVLLHNAAIAACDSILQAVGLRVTSGDRSHIPPRDGTRRTRRRHRRTPGASRRFPRTAQRSVLRRQLHRPSKHPRRRGIHDRTLGARARLHRRQRRRTQLNTPGRRADGASAEARLTLRGPRDNQRPELPRIPAAPSEVTRQSE